MPARLTVTPAFTQKRQGDVLAMKSAALAALTLPFQNITAAYVDTSSFDQNKAKLAEIVSSSKGDQVLREFVGLLMSVTQEKRAELIANKFTGDVNRQLLEAIPMCLEASCEDTEVVKALGVTTEIANKHYERVIEKVGDILSERYTAEDLDKLLPRDSDFYNDIKDIVADKNNTDFLDAERRQCLKASRLETLEETRGDMLEKQRNLVTSLLEPQEEEGSKKDRFALLDDTTYSKVIFGEILKFMQTPESERPKLLEKYRAAMQNLFENTEEKKTEKYAVLSDILKTVRDAKLVKKSLPSHTFYRPEQYYTKQVSQFISNTASSEVQRHANQYAAVLSNLYELPAAQRAAAENARPMMARSNTYEAVVCALDKSRHIELDAEKTTPFKLLEAEPRDLVGRFADGLEPRSFIGHDIMTPKNLKADDDSLVTFKNPTEMRALANILANKVVTKCITSQ